MSWNSQWEAEERQIDEMVDEGRMTPHEAQTQHRDLQCAYRESAREAAQEAYDNELRNW